MSDDAPSLRDRRVVLTGAGSGFGRTQAICFARRGAHLHLSARTLEKAGHTAGCVRDDVPGAMVTAHACDVTQAADIAQFAAEIAAHTDRVDILVHNASAWLTGGIESGTDEAILQTVNSTLSGAILLTRRLLPLLRRSPAPDIVFINATPALPGDRHDEAHAAFSAAKAALATFAERLRDQECGWGLRVITLFPPNFENASPLDPQAWASPKPAGGGNENTITARHVFECIEFALTRDRICTLESIVLGSNNGAHT